MLGVARVCRLLDSSCSVSIVSRARLLAHSTPWIVQRANSTHTDPSTTIDPSSTPSIGGETLSLNNSIGDAAIETSSQAKWVADAAVSLPPQGDLASIGLGGHSPVGLLQSTLEWIHVTTGLPWWASIVTCTVMMRLALFPLAIKLQRNAARMNNIRPQMDKIMAKIKEYQQMGNSMMAAQESSRLMLLYKEHDCNPIKMMAAPFLQLPIFLSFFIAIRKMAAAPVESMKTGGTLWFVDLTLPDPFYILPFAACASFIVTLEMGGETGVTNPQVEKMKFFFRCMAILLVPVTASFPTGLFMYWLTSSIFSLSQIMLLKVPSVRTALKIPPIVKHPKPDGDDGTHEGTARPGSGLVKQIKDSYRNAVLVDEVKRKDAMAKKKYNSLLSTSTTKLYDKPPHKRTQSD